MSTPEESAEADMLAALAARFGLTPEQALATLKSSSAPTVEKFIKKFLERQTVNTRRSYSTHLLWFRDGIEPTCDQKCEPCMDVEIRFACRCDCSKCVASRISLEAQGPKPLSENSCSKENAEIVAGTAARCSQAGDRREPSTSEPGQALEGGIGLRSAGDCNCGPPVDVHLRQAVGCRRIMRRTSRSPTASVGNDVRCATSSSSNSATSRRQVVQTLSSTA